MPKLSDKYEAFCQEYVKDLNITQAMIRAGYSPKYANAEGYKVLGKLGIQERIAEIRAQSANNEGITLDQILAEYAKLAFFDIRKLYNEAGNLIPIHELDDATAGAIGGVEVLTIGTGDNQVGTTTKVKVWEKRAALDSLCKVLGHNAPVKQELSGSVAIEQITGIEIK
jgi:phage terminase small subunit